MLILSFGLNIYAHYFILSVRFTTLYKMLLPASLTDQQKRNKVKKLADRDAGQGWQRLQRGPGTGGRLALKAEGGLNAVGFRRL